MTTEEFNVGVRQWTADTRRKLKRNIIQMTTQYSGRSRRELKSSTRMEHGEINRIGFSFPHYMIFVHKGAGRGYHGAKKLVANSEKTGVFQAMTGRMMGTGRRMPKEWFNPEIEAGLPKLSQLIFDYKGDEAIDRIQSRLFNQIKID